MGGKKKDGGAPKKAAKKDQDAGESTALLFRKYKKNCERLSAPISHKLVEKLSECVTEGGDLTEVHLWEELRWSGVRALMEALDEEQYQHVKSLRLWKTEAEDEGVRAVAQFLKTNKSVRILEFLDCKVTPLGCEFLGRVLAPSVGTAVTVLKLDHNEIGSEGAVQLAKGLSMNPTLVSLSLSYCGITAEGAEALFEMIIFQRSSLKELNLQGNHLRNEGAKEVFWGLRVAKVLEKVNLSDNQFGRDDELMGLVKTCMEKNKVLGTYDLRFNGINDADAMKIVDVLPECPHVHDVMLGERLSEPVYTALQEALKANKPRRGKKKGKGGKKKKKGKK